MLPKKNRLLKKEFQEVFKKGKGINYPPLFLKFLKNRSKEKKFSVLVSKKISKKATQRNKIKRRLRELIRIKLERIKEGIKGILITQPGIEKKNFHQIEEILEKLFKKAKIFKL